MILILDHNLRPLVCVLGSSNGIKVYIYVLACSLQAQHNSYWTFCTVKKRRQKMRQNFSPLLAKPMLQYAIRKPHTQLFKRFVKNVYKKKQGGVCRCFFVVNFRATLPHVTRDKGKKETSHFFSQDGNDSAHIQYILFLLLCV